MESSKKFKVISLVLLMLTSGLMISVVVLAALYSSVTDGGGTTTVSPVTPTPKLCTTPACIKAANMILENMDETVNPCEDFNMFSCGGFIKNKRIPSDATSIDPLVDLSVNLDNDVADELSAANDSDIEAIKNAKKFYRSCMNENVIESVGEQRLIDVIKNDIGGWQLLDSSYSLTPGQFFGKLALLDKKMGTRPFFELMIRENPKNPTKNILRIQQPGVFYDKRYYESEDFMRAYKEFAVAMVRALNKYNETAFNEQDVENMVILEKQISMHLLDPTERRSLKYRNTTVGNMNTEFPGIDWVDYIVTKIFAGQHNVDSKETILVDDASYFSNITELYSSNLTELKDLDNLAVWLFVRSKANYLPKAYRDIRAKFDNVLQGLSNPPPRARICASIVVQRMPFAVGRLYVNKRFPEASKQAAKEMIQNIRDEFKTILKGVDWMDAESKTKAEEKVDTIDVQIGYPDYTNNDTYMNNLYKEFQLDENDFLKNFVIVNTGEVKKAIEEFRTERTFKDWLITPAIVNAYYSPDQNQICFPAGILQAPLYDAQVPNYLNYGGIGSIIGHEITHGFDDQGRKFDKNGVMFDDDQAGGLWSPETIAKYNEKAKCISEQYSNYLVKQINMTLNGDLTLGENIADNGGIKEAYQAYRRWVADKNKGQSEDLLPGLKYNPNQLFFINYAQAWCTKWTDESLRAQVLSNYHSPGEFRIIGPTSNSKDFADVFECKTTTPNNPTKKCTVW